MIDNTTNVFKHPDGGSQVSSVVRLEAV
jgi:hypothetical protein